MENKGENFPTVIAVMSFNPFLVGRGYKDQLKELAKKAIYACVFHKCQDTLYKVFYKLNELGIDRDWMEQTFNEIKESVKAQKTPIVKASNQQRRDSNSKLSNF